MGTVSFSHACLDDRGARAGQFAPPPHGAPGRLDSEEKAVEAKSKGQRPTKSRVNGADPIVQGTSAGKRLPDLPGRRVRLFPSMYARLPLGVHRGVAGQRQKEMPGLQVSSAGSGPSGG